MNKAVILKTLVILPVLCFSLLFAQGSNPLVGKWGMSGAVAIEFTATKMISVAAKAAMKAMNMEPPPDTEYKVVGNKVQGKDPASGKWADAFTFKIEGKKLTLTPIDDPDEAMELEKM